MLIALSLGLFGAASAPAQPVPSFYNYTGAEGGSVHGALIRSEPLPRSPAGTRTYRILYWSSSADGKLLPVSGMVIVPTGPAPASGRPVVSWAHPTTGVQPRCAPSLSPLRFMMTAGLTDMVKQGYVVAATDYPGLGAGSNHPFLDGQSEGRAVLDAVRAASAVPGASPLSDFALWGHSQGGQAVLFAATMANIYTPELRLAGVAAAAPASNLAQLLSDDLGTTGGNNLTALALWAWAGTYGAAYEGVVDPRALPAIETIAAKCVDAIIESSAERQASKILSSSFLTVPDITKVEPWRAIIARNTIGTLPANIPVFIAQGDADVIVRPNITYGYVKNLCARGSRLTLDVLSRVGHGWAAVKSAAAAVNWIKDRLNKLPAPSDCERLQRITAAQHG